jgi:ribosomal protein L29
VSELREDLKKVINKCLELDDSQQDGTYLHWLTRVKAGYAVNTITIDDFEEIDEQLTTDILTDIIPIIEQENKALKDLLRKTKCKHEVLGECSETGCNCGSVNNCKELVSENKALKNKLAEIRINKINFKELLHLRDRTDTLKAYVRKMSQEKQQLKNKLAELRGQINCTCGGVDPTAEILKYRKALANIMLILHSYSPPVGHSAYCLIQKVLKEINELEASDEPK